MCDIADLPGKPIIVHVGDLNLHVDDPSKRDVSRYLALLSQRDLCQKAGHILDHVICRSDDDLLLECKVSPNMYGSDHHMVECKVNKLKLMQERKTITMGSFKDLDLEASKADMSHELRDYVCLQDPEKQAEAYNTKVRKILDKDCLEQSHSQKVIRSPLWFDDNVRAART